MAKSCFSKEAYKQVTISSCNEYSGVSSFLSVIPGRGMKAHFKHNFVFLKKLRSQVSFLVFLEFSHKHSEFPLKDSIVRPSPNSQQTIVGLVKEVYIVRKILIHTLKCFGGVFASVISDF